MRNPPEPHCPQRCHQGGGGGMAVPSCFFASPSEHEAVRNMGVRRGWHRSPITVDAHSGAPARPSGVMPTSFFSRGPAGFPVHGAGMKTKMLLVVVGLVALTGLSRSSLAESNWPRFRGPAGSGVADGDKPPVE